MKTNQKKYLFRKQKRKYYSS